jgi:hypothetical protein
MCPIFETYNLIQRRALTIWFLRSNIRRCNH